MANIIESQVTLEDEVFEETIDVAEEPIEVVRPSSYNDLQDLPQVNGVTLQGNKTSSDLGIVTQNDINSAVSAEATLRENADTALGGRIDQEITARGNADTALGGRIDGEITNRTNADNALGTRIDNEILARQGGDNNLQTQIDAITSKSDVVDVVANYAALQAYDTQHLGNNDVIKVLDDETHDDAQTYYRWNKTAGTWSYIGSEAPYYSKGQIDQQMQAKQDKLTAGTGITLDGATISADTTVLATKDDLEPEIVADLPTVGDTTKLYLTPTNKTASGNPITIDLKENVGQMTSFRLDGNTFQQTYTGKNLFDKDNYSEIQAYIDRNGVLVSNANNIAVYIPCEANTTYTISRKVPTSGNTKFGVGYTTTIPAGDVQLYDWTRNYDAQNLTVTTGAGAAYLAVWVYVTDYVETKAQTMESIQIEVGSTATSYEPYVGGVPSPNPSYPQPIQTVTGEQTVTINGANYPIDLGTIELCKIVYNNTFQDYIYKDNGEWKIHKTIAKTVANGSETWTVANAGTSNFYYVSNGLVENPYGSDTGRYIKCNYEAGAQVTNSNTTSGVFLLSGGTVRLRSGAEMTAQAWQAKLSQNNMIIYNAMATATDTAITDQTLIAQLEAIRTAALGNGANTITNTATGTNLAGSMSIGYYGYNPSEYSEWLYVDGAWEQVGGRPIPTKTSELANDSQYVTRDDIASKLQTLVVDELPSIGEEGKLYLAPKNYTRSTGTGNPITAIITDGAGKMESFKLDGDTYQQSYTGKNLCRITLPNTSTVVYSDNTITLNGSRGTAGNLQDTSNIGTRLVAGTYTVRAFLLSGSASGNGTRFIMRIGDNVFTVRSNISGVSEPLSVTLDSDTDVTLQIWVDSSTTYDNLKIGYQIEAGSTATPYEPYVGGVPSPNPDYPQQIQTVTGEQTVEIVGKNLFDKNNANIIRGYIGGTYFNAGTDYTIWIPCEENTDYAIQKIIAEPQSANRFRINCYNQVPAGGVASLGSQYLWNGGDGSDVSSHVYTTPAGAKYLGVTVMTQNSGGDTTIDDILASIQIEKGSTATTYAPYSKQTYPLNLGNIELCKLDTYQDYIWKDGDNWKIRKRILPIVMDGNTSITPNQFGTNSYAISISQQVTRADSQLSSVCEYFYGIKYNDRAQEIPNSTFIADATGQVRVIIVRNTGFTTSEALSSWFDTYRPKFYCTATSSDTTITDTDLIAQLEAIRTASLENGTNTITNSAPAPNLAGDMEISYYGYNPTNRYDKFIWLDLNNNYEQIGE